MSAAELATVVEGWATLAGLFVVIVGASFAGVQLRRESKSRRLEALVNLYEVMWPREMLDASTIVASLPDDFEFTRLDSNQKQAVMHVTASLERLGHVLRAGLVQEEEIFNFTPLGRAPIFLWEKLKRFIRTGVTGVNFAGERRDALHLDVDFEYLAWRAQAYFTKHAVEEFGTIPIFDADLGAVERANQQAQQARVPAT